MTKTLEHLKALGVKYVAWDMDHTACREHSTGVLSEGKHEIRDPYTNYAKNINRWFKTIVPIFNAEGIQQAIATHSDGIQEYQPDLKDKKPMAGLRLVNMFLYGSTFGTGTKPIGKQKKKEFTVEWTNFSKDITFDVSAHKSNLTIKNDGGKRFVYKQDPERVHGNKLFNMLELKHVTLFFFLGLGKIFFVFFK